MSNLFGLMHQTPDESATLSRACQAGDLNAAYQVIAGPVSRVHRNPLELIAIALGAGFGIGVPKARKYRSLVEGLQQDIAAAVPRKVDGFGMRAIRDQVSAQCG